MTDRAGKTIDDVRQFWDTTPLFAGEGSAAQGTREWFEEHERIYLVDVLAGRPPAILTDGISRDARLLDVGCGPGFWVRFFLRRGFARVAACDLTQAAVDLTTRSLELFGLRADVQVGNAEALPYASGSVDHVNCQGVIHHTPDPRKAVEEFARVLAPRGTVCLSVYYRNYLLRHPRMLGLAARVLGSSVGLEGRGRESLLASGNADEIVRRYDGASNPIGRAYTTDELRQLVSGVFEVERIERFYFPARAFGLTLPGALHRWMARRFGLMIILSGRKPASA